MKTPTPSQQRKINKLLRNVMIQNLRAKEKTLEILKQPKSKKKLIEQLELEIKDLRRQLEPPKKKRKKKNIKSKPIIKEVLEIW